MTIPEIAKKVSKSEEYVKEVIKKIRLLVFEDFSIKKYKFFTVSVTMNGDSLLAFIRQLIYNFIIVAVL